MPTAEVENHWLRRSIEEKGSRLGVEVTSIDRGRVRIEMDEKEAEYLLGEKQHTEEEVEQARSEGYDDGHQEGYDEGLIEGHADATEELALKILGDLYEVVGTTNADGKLEERITETLDKLAREYGVNP